MKRMNRILFALVALIGSGGIAQASIQSSWPLLAFDSANDCELSIIGNGKFFELRAEGMIPGEALHFTLTNGDMKPIDWQVYASGTGRWSKLYLPFRFGRDGGTVTARIEAARCDLSASVPWTRTVRVID